MTLIGTIERGRIVLRDPLDLPDGTSVAVDLRPLPASFWEDRSLDQLAAEQAVTSRSPADLAGDWPETDSIDDFLATVHQGRE